MCVCGGGGGGGEGGTLRANRCFIDVLWAEGAKKVKGV